MEAREATPIPKRCPVSLTQSPLASASRVAGQWVDFEVAALWGGPAVSSYCSEAPGVAHRGSQRWGHVGGLSAGREEQPVGQTGFLLSPLWLPGLPPPCLLVLEKLQGFRSKEREIRLEMRLTVAHVGLREMGIGGHSRGSCASSHVWSIFGPDGHQLGGGRGSQRPGLVCATSPPPPGAAELEGNSASTGPCSPSWVGCPKPREGHGTSLSSHLSPPGAGLNPFCFLLLSFGTGFGACPPSAI